MRLIAIMVRPCQDRGSSSGERATMLPSLAVPSLADPCVAKAGPSGIHAIWVRGLQREIPHRVGDFSGNPGLDGGLLSLLLSNHELG
jgi:hypothetical protein